MFYSNTARAKSSSVVGSKVIDRLTSLKESTKNKKKSPNQRNKRVAVLLVRVCPHSCFARRSLSWSDLGDIVVLSHFLELAVQFLEQCIERKRPISLLSKRRGRSERGGLDPMTIQSCGLLTATFSLCDFMADFNTFSSC